MLDFETVSKRVVISSVLPALALVFLVWPHESFVQKLARAAMIVVIVQCVILVTIFARDEWRAHKAERLDEPPPVT